MLWGIKMEKRNTKKITDDIFGLANNLASDIIGSENKGLNFRSKRSAFGNLIDSQQEQVIIISKAYEDELIGLSNKISELEGNVEGFETIIANLEADKENLEELLGKYQEEKSKSKDEKASKKEDGKKKSKSKILK